MCVGPPNINTYLVGEHMTVKLYDLFKHVSKNKGTIPRRREMVSRQDFIDTISQNIKNIKIDDIFLTKKYHEYCSLYNIVELSSFNGIPSILGFYSNSSTLEYFTSRGWSEAEAKKMLKDKQTTNSLSAIMKKHGVCKENAQKILIDRSKRGQETLQRRDDYDVIKKSRGRGNSIDFIVTKINPSTGANYTRDEAKKYISNKQQKALNCFWSSVRTGDVVYYPNTTIEYYLRRGFSLEESNKMLKNRQITFSLDKCISKHGEIDGFEIWKKRQQKWLNTLDSFPDEKKRDILIRKTYRSKRFSKEATIFIDKLLKKFNMCIGDDGVYACEREWFIVYDKKIFFYDLYIKQFNLFLEYNGSIWHPNIKKLKTQSEWDSWINPVSRMTANEVCIKDTHKKNIAIKNGGIFFTVWDTDDHDEKIEEIYNFVNSRKLNELHKP